MAYYNGLGNELGAGLGDFAKQLLGTQNTLQQQAQQKAEQDRQYALQQQQASEQTRQYDANFKYNRDKDAYDHLNAQRIELVKNLQMGAYDKDPLLKARAQQVLQQNGKFLSMAEKGQIPKDEDAAAYDAFYQDFADVAGLGAAQLGVNAARRDDAATTLAGNQAALSDLQVKQATDTAQSTIDAINAGNDKTVIEAGIYKQLAAYTTAAQKAVYLKSIADSGSIGAGLVAGLGLDTETMNALKTRMGQVDTTNAAAATVAQGQADLVPFTVHDAKRTSAIADKYADPQAAANLDATLTSTAGNKVATALSQAELDKVTATFDSTVKAINSTNDVTVQKNNVTASLLNLDGAASRAEYLGRIAAQGDMGKGIIDGLEKDGIITPDMAAAAREKAGRVTTADQAQLDILLDQTKITSNDRAKSDATLKSSIDVFNSDASLKVKTNEAAGGLLELRTAGEKAAYLEGIAKLGAPGQAILDGLKDRGIITAQQAATFKAKATNAQTVETATTSTATTQAAAAAFDLTRAKALFPIELKSSQTALDSARQALDEARQGAPLRIETLRQNLATLKFDLDHAKDMAPLQLAQARAQVDALESEVRVAEATEAGRISTVNSGAKTAEAQATSAQATATVDLATIPAAIASRNLAPQQAQAALTAQLNENKFADKTFAARVQALDLSNSTGLQQLLTMKQQYSQNAAKFPEELKYLTAQTAVMNAQAKEAAAKLLDSNGTGVTDRKSMASALQRMQIGNSDLLRQASSSYRLTVDKLIPNAKFSVDKYDPKNFSVLIAGTTNLTDAQKQELQNAATELDTRKSAAADLITALGQNAGKGRIDPKVAERLGITTLGEADGSDPYGVQDMGGVKAITKFTGTAPIPQTFNGEARYAVSKTASNLGVDPNALAAVISFETGGTFNPAAQPPIDPKTGKRPSTATGLIQFMESTAKGLGTSTAALRAMPFATQMKYVEQYLRGRGIGPGSSMADIYQAVAGSGYKAGSDAYEQNKVWDSNGNGVIEPGEQTLNPQFAAHVRDYFGGTPAAGPQAPGTAPTTTPAATTTTPTTAAPPKAPDVQATLTAQATKLQPFYDRVKRAPNTQAAQKMLMDQAILLAGGPNAPQALKAQYFDALLAAARQ